MKGWQYLSLIFFLSHLKIHQLVDRWSTSFCQWCKMVLTQSLLIHYVFFIVFKLLSIFRILHNVDDVFFLLPITLHTVMGMAQNMIIPKNWEVYLIARLGKRQMKKLFLVEFYKIPPWNMSESIIWVVS